MQVGVWFLLFTIIDHIGLFEDELLHSLAAHHLNGVIVSLQENLSLRSIWSAIDMYIVGWLLEVLHIALQLLSLFKLL